jgi:hypothetical protein
MCWVKIRRGRNTHISELNTYHLHGNNGEGTQSSIANRCLESRSQHGEVEEKEEVVEEEKK